LDVPEHPPRILTPEALAKLREALGFLVLFGKIWIGVGGGLAILFGVGAMLVTPVLVIGAVIGGVFLVAGVVLITLGNRGVRRVRRILETGRLLTGVVVENAVNYALRKHRRYATRIICRSVDPASQVETTHRFNTWDPAVIEAHPVGREVALIVDPQDPARAVAPSLLQTDFAQA